MEDVILEWDKLSDSLREPFVGIPVHIEFDCNCAICQKSPIETQRKRLHIAIYPLDKDIDFQHAWYIYSAKKISSWGAFVLALNRLNIRARNFEFLKEMMKKTIFEWHDQQVVKFLEEYGKVKAPARLPEALSKRTVWLPMRIVPPTELEFIARESIRDETGKVLELEQIIEKAAQEWKEELKRHEQEYGETGEIEYDMTNL